MTTRGLSGMTKGKGKGKKGTGKGFGKQFSGLLQHMWHVGATKAIDCKSTGAKEIDGARCHQGKQRQRKLLIDRKNRAGSSMVQEKNNSVMSSKKHNNKNETAI